VSHESEESHESHKSHKSQESQDRPKNDTRALWQISIAFLSWAVVGNQQKLQTPEARSDPAFSKDIVVLSLDPENDLTNGHWMDI
jgi:hypothetical protein